MGLGRGPVSVVDLAADEDARGGEVGRGAAAEAEWDARPLLRRIELHFAGGTRRPIGDRIAEDLREVPQHAVVERSVVKAGIPAGMTVAWWPVPAAW